jgi:hypothetical protein
MASVVDPRHQVALSAHNVLYNNASVACGPSSDWTLLFLRSNGGGRAVFCVQPRLFIMQLHRTGFGLGGRIVGKLRVVVSEGASVNVRLELLLQIGRMVGAGV